MSRRWLCDRTGGASILQKWATSIVAPFWCRDLLFLVIALTALSAGLIAFLINVLGSSL